MSGNFGGVGAIGGPPSANYGAGNNVGAPGVGAVGGSLGSGVPGPAGSSGAPGGILGGMAGMSGMTGMGGIAGGMGGPMGGIGGMGIGPGFPMVVPQEREVTVVESGQDTVIQVFGHDLSPEQLEVTLEGQMLVVSIAATSMFPPTRREIPFPVGASASSIEAAFVDGMLVVKFPKPLDRKTIPVTAMKPKLKLQARSLRKMHRVSMWYSQATIAILSMRGQVTDVQLSESIGPIPPILNTTVAEFFGKQHKIFNVQPAPAPAADGTTLLSLQPTFKLPRFQVGNCQYFSRGFCRRKCLCPFRHLLSEKELMDAYNPPLKKKRKQKKKRQQKKQAEQAQKQEAALQKQKQRKRQRRKQQRRRDASEGSGRGAANAKGAAAQRRGNNNPGGQGAQASSAGGAKRSGASGNNRQSGGGGGGNRNHWQRVNRSARSGSGGAQANPSNNQARGASGSGGGGRRNQGRGGNQRRGPW